MALWFLRLAITFFFVSWSVFIASLLLPAYGGMESPGTPLGTPLSGWQAMTSPLLLGMAMPWLPFVEPRFFVFLLFPLTNLAVLLLPFFVFSLQEDCGVLAPFLLIPAAMAWVFPPELYDHVLLGFYCWNFSHLSMALGTLLVGCAFKYRDNFAMLLPSKPSHASAYWK